MLLAMLVAAIASAATGASSLPVSQCSPSQHICHGKCPPLPPGAELPRSGGEGLCLRESNTGACVCWLSSPADKQHTQTLFKCETDANNTRREVMCLPPSFCFAPDDSPSCMIVPHCPCNVIAGHGTLSGWYPVVALILRSKTPVQPEQDTPTEYPQGGDSREFSMKHLLFLLAFVIAPLLCWCLLTFFHEGKCRKKRRPCPEAQPMPTDRADELTTTCPSPTPQLQEPTAPKLLESPPPYRVALDPGESCLLPPVDCGPPPSYEDAVRNPVWPTTAVRIQEMNDP